MQIVTPGSEEWFQEAKQLLELTRELDRLETSATFCKMIKACAPWFQIEEVHLLLGGYLEAVKELEIKRLIVLEPPRAGKSTQGSVFFPGHWMGHYPSDKVLQVGHSSDFSCDFGRQCRDLIMSEDYAHLYPYTRLRADSKSAKRWNTTDRGSYYAAGQRSPIAGKGFNLGVTDDLISEQDRDSTVAKQRVTNWWVPGFLSRQQPERNAIVNFQTRWSADDPAGWLIRQMETNPAADQYTVLKIPALIDEATAEIFNELTNDPLIDGEPMKFKAGDSFCPRRHPKDNLLKLKENASERDWNALWMQEPIDEGGNIYKRFHWRQWDGQLPKFEMVYQTYDTAFEEEQINRGDYSARITWGVFWHEPKKPDETVPGWENIPPEKPGYRLMMLERMNRRLGFPELRREVMDAAKLWRPDRLIIERKASGISLLQEMKRIPGTRVMGFNPKNKSKTSRASVASVVLEKGLVYYPSERRWPTEVIEQCAEFPRTVYDDLVDCVTMGFIFFRRLFILMLPNEADDSEDFNVQPKRRGYGSTRRVA